MASPSPCIWCMVMRCSDSQAHPEYMSPTVLTRVVHQRQLQKYSDGQDTEEYAGSSETGQVS